MSYSIGGVSSMPFGFYGDSGFIDNSVFTSNSNPNFSVGSQGTFWPSAYGSAAMWGSLPQVQSPVVAVPIYALDYSASAPIAASPLLSSPLLNQSLNDIGLLGTSFGTGAIGLPALALENPLLSASPLGVGPDLASLSLLSNIFGADARQEEFERTVAPQASPANDTASIAMFTKLISTVLEQQKQDKEDAKVDADQKDKPKTDAQAGTAAPNGGANQVGQTGDTTFTATTATTQGGQGNQPAADNQLAEMIKQMSETIAKLTEEVAKLKAEKDKPQQPATNGAGTGGTQGTTVTNTNGNGVTQGNGTTTNTQGTTVTNTNGNGVTQGTGNNTTTATQGTDPALQAQIQQTLNQINTTLANLNQNNNTQTQVDPNNGQVTTQGGGNGTQVTTQNGIGTTTTTVGNNTGVGTQTTGQQTGVGATTGVGTQTTGQQTGVGATTGVGTQTTGQQAGVGTQTTGQQTGVGTTTTVINPTGMGTQTTGQTGVGGTVTQTTTVTGGVRPINPVSTQPTNQVTTRPIVMQNTGTQPLNTQTVINQTQQAVNDRVQTLKTSPQGTISGGGGNNQTPRPVSSTMVVRK